MSRALPFTELSLRRAIRAARKEGLAIQAVTVKADGSVTVHSGDMPSPLVPSSQPGTSKWEDVEA